MNGDFSTGRSLPAAFGAVTVLQTDGSPVPLATAWADRPAVLVWVRHFG